MALVSTTQAGREDKVTWPVRQRHPPRLLQRFKRGEPFFRGFRHIVFPIGWFSERI